MTIETLDRQEAINDFLSRIIARAYDGAIEGTRKTLEKGPPGRQPPENRLAIHNWFQTLNNEERELVLALVREAADAAVFGCLVLLDNMTGGYPIEDKVSDFALYLQSYEDDAARDANTPVSSVRLNPRLSSDYDLHDRFRLVLQERAEGRK
jgi:hypothetical protein